MSVYNENGTEISVVYNRSGISLSQCYDADGVVIPLSGGGGDDDYDDYYTEYQHSILNARDAWKTQYRSDNTVIPLILHADQHEQLTTNDFSRGLFSYLKLAIKWDEVSACIGLGDVDMFYSNYQNTFTLLSRIPANKQINIWGNHDLWNFTDESGSQYVTDWDTFHFDNSAYGDVSYEYNKKGIEYHVDRAHNVKYVCIAGWEIDKSKGGHSHYCITSDSMEAVIDMLEQEDGYDIVILTHCAALSNLTSKYDIGSSDDAIVSPTKGSGALTDLAITNIPLDEMLYARKNHTSGSIKDSYGNTHNYDFTNTTGDVLCCLNGHGHYDRYGYSSYGGLVSIMYDAYAYGKNPFYMINIDRTNRTIDGWKILNTGDVYSYSIPFDDDVDE